MAIADKPVKTSKHNEEAMLRARVYQARRDGEAAKRAKIKELQERFGIKPKKPNP